MHKLLSSLLISATGLALPSLADTPLRGFFPQSVQAERDLEARFKTMPDPARMRAAMQRLSARPHHVGSPYDKDNAEWILAKFKEWGLDAHIENFDVLFPTPKERAVELVEPTHFTAKLQEPAVPEDPTSNQQNEQLPTFNAFSIDGDVTAPLVYVNYGVPADYEGAITGRGERLAEAGHVLPGTAVAVLQDGLGLDRLAGEIGIHSRHHVRGHADW